MLLDAIFRSAYRQKTNKDEHNRNITNELRTFRDCNWFDTVKTTHSRERKAEGIAPRTETNATKHEQILNDILGRAWNTEDMDKTN